MKKFSCILAALLVACLMLAACGAQPAQSTAGTAQSAASGQPEGQPAQTEAGDNVLRMAYYAPSMMDPAFGANNADDNVTRLIYDFLVFVDENYVPDPARGVAESWEVSEDGTVWTFNLRKGVKFHDGKEMTSRDVKFSFDRLRDPDVGAPTVSVYANITDIAAPDDYTVVFTLAQQNPDFLLDLFDFHAKIVDADATDFQTSWNGTGPFIVERYVPEDRIVYTRNPNYWMVDDEGTQLPYLDGIEYLFMADQSAQVEALRGGQVDYILALPAEFVPSLEENADITVYRKASNYHYPIRMRSDQGPAADNRVREALKLGTDRQAILEGAIGGLGVTGRDTPIGPAFSNYYLDVPELERDVEKAKQLLAEAGYADGLDITLHTQQTSPVPAIATIWKEQMAEIGVNVEIQLVSSEIYYGDDVWLEVDFGITDWGPRPYPQPYLDLSYVTGALWNETHWSNAELDALAAEAAKEMDEEKRTELYQEIQQVFIDEGPIIVPFFIDNIYAARSNVKGVVPHFGMSLDMRMFYFEN